jgi:POT family proton-dependent oligopeptide transporter
LMGGNFEQLYSYVSVYAGLGLVCILVGLGALVLSPFVKGLMGGVE